MGAKAPVPTFRSIGSSMLVGPILVLLVSLPGFHAKDFDWDDLGAALTSKTQLGNANGASPASNLRILVSPQRRMTKR